MNDYLSLILGIACAGIGGDLFVRGVVGLSRWARISPALAGATLAAIATSSPELTVSINAALGGVPQIALGDALGSNVVNVALVLGAALAISGIQSSRDSVKRDFTAALLVPVVTGLFLFDGKLSRGDGLLMLSMFIAWLIAVVIEARRQRGEEEEEGAEERRNWLIILQNLGGLVFLIAAGRLIVAGARGIAASFGIGEFVIGATIVAMGTGAPEIATTLISKLRGHSEVGLGTILGSNIFNGLLIVPVATLISPISVDWSEVAVALAFGLLAVALTFPGRNDFIERWRGFLLLALYAIYIVVITQRRTG